MKQNGQQISIGLCEQRDAKYLEVCIRVARAFLQKDILFKIAATTCRICASQTYICWASAGEA
jgi:hypothetical protein